MRVFRAFFIRTKVATLTIIVIVRISHSERYWALETRVLFFLIVEN